MLLEIEETERLPMAGALQTGPDVDAEGVAESDLGEVDLVRSCPS